MDTLHYPAPAPNITCRRIWHSRTELLNLSFYLSPERKCMYLYVEFCGYRKSGRLFFTVRTCELFAITDRQRSGLQFETIEGIIIQLHLSVLPLNLRFLIIRTKLRNQALEDQALEVLQDNGDAAATGIQPTSYHQVRTQHNIAVSHRSRLLSQFDGPIPDPITHNSSVH